MTVQPTLFTEIFGLWPEETRDVHLARDMGVGRSRARQWLRRNFLPVWYWPRLVDVAEQKFGRIFTYRQLVEATATQRGPSYIAGQAQGAETRRRNREGEEQGEAA